MRVITYLAFTLLSIVIQFCVMDFIQGKTKGDDKPLGLNATTQKKRLNDILKNFTDKPHAIYYRTQLKQADNQKKSESVQKYSNSTLPQTPLETSTDFSSTIFEVLYDENMTVTEDMYTTEPMFTATDYDNVTELIFFKNNRNDTVKTNISPKTANNKDCSCNLLFQVCDINCCCDSDCTEAEQKMFLDCNEDAHRKDESESFCYSPISFYSNRYGSDFNNFFCIAKTNLPEKRNINYNKHDPAVINKHLKWHSHGMIKPQEKFARKPYKYGDPVWLLKNGSVYYSDLPSTLMNYYCSGRNPIKFLIEEKKHCNVKLTDLEMFHIISSVVASPVISATEKSLNSSALNCSTLHCTNWSIIVCDEQTCTNYNRSLHDPLCTENVCTHLALKVHYIFYYHESKIINATIKLHIQEISLSVPFLTQEIQVNFIIANKSADQIIELSGNPGYISGLPVIVSYKESNHTNGFYNNTAKGKKYLTYPLNKNGVCVPSNITESFVIFGSNKRVRCRYVHHHTPLLHNKTTTDTCNRIQNNINQIMGLSSKVMVSPYGNPEELTDEDWIPRQIGMIEEPVYGEFKAQHSKLLCYNLVTRISLIFTYADTSDIASKRKNTILSAHVGITASNVSFAAEDVSTVITVDTVFIDETKPSVYEYAGGPQLNIHLPNDFFFPFPSNKVCHAYKCNVCVICVFIAAIVIK